MIPVTRKAPLAALSHDALFLSETVDLYSAEPNLLSLPQLVFEIVGRMVGADVVTFSEVDLKTKEFRGLVSVEEPVERRAQRMTAYAKHMHSHPFWSGDPEFYGERALRDTDFFSTTEFHRLPIAREALLPAGARHVISIALEVRNYVVRTTGYREVGRRPFPDRARDRLQALRPHLMRVYRQAQDRTIAELSAIDRLRYAFPALTARQLEVAAWLGEGKTNDTIATILGIGVDAVKAHVRGILEGLGVETRLGVAITCQSAPPFSNLPPLWKLPTGAWSPGGVQPN